MPAPPRRGARVCLRRNGPSRRATKGPKQLFLTVNSLLVFAIVAQQQYLSNWPRGRGSRPIGRCSGGGNLAGGALRGVAPRRARRRRAPRRAGASRAPPQGPELRVENATPAGSTEWPPPCMCPVRSHPVPSRTPRPRCAGLLELSGGRCEKPCRVSKTPESQKSSRGGSCLEQAAGASTSAIGPSSSGGMPSSVPRAQIAEDARSERESARTE